MKAKALFEILLSFERIQARGGGAGGSIRPEAESESSFDSSCRGCRRIIVVC